MADAEDSSPPPQFCGFDQPAERLSDWAVGRAVPGCARSGARGATPALKFAASLEALLRRFYTCG